MIKQLVSAVVVGILIGMVLSAVEVIFSKIN
jgi:F0F1-type ATP synthase assembly protein I